MSGSSDEFSDDVLYENLLSKFERQLNAGEEPAIDLFLAKCLRDDRKPLLFVEMLTRELERLKSGGALLGDEVKNLYKQQFAPFASEIEEVWHAVKQGRPAATAQFPANDKQRSSRAPVIEGSPYTFGGRIGEGAFGEVWDAMRTVDGHARAIKVLRAEFDAKQSDLLKEAAKLERLRHDGIVAAYAVGLTKDKRVFIEMERMKGDLRALMREPHFDHLRSAAPLVKKIAEAVQYAHRKGINHFDLKPENVFVDEMNNPKVGDFGLAVHHSERGTAMTQDGGTPGYMSPEMYEFGVDGCDERADIWSLGVILYELLIGELPFSNRDQITGEWRPSPHRRNPAISQELEQTCLQCWKRNPKDRFQSADELVKALTALSSRTKESSSLCPGNSTRARTSVVNPIPLPVRRLDTAFLGRENEVETILNILRVPTGRITAIVGPTGYGKTALAINVINQVVPNAGEARRATFDSVVWIDCQSGCSLDYLLTQFAKVMGVDMERAAAQGEPAFPAQRRIDSTLKALSETSEFGMHLVVLDNLESMLQPDGVVREEGFKIFIERILEFQHSLHVLVTTQRLPLVAFADRIVRISLDDGLALKDAVAYLRQRGRELRWNDQDEAQLVSAANRVHRVPQAMNSLISYMTLDTTDPLSVLLQNSELFREFDCHDIAQGQKRLYLRQFAALADEERATLRILAACRAPIQSDMLILVDGLIRYSRVMRRLELHGLARAEPTDAEQSGYRLREDLKELLYSQMDSAFHNEIASALATNNAIMHEQLIHGGPNLRHLLHYRLSGIYLKAAHALEERVRFTSGGDIGFRSGFPREPSLALEQVRYALEGFHHIYALCLMTGDWAVFLAGHSRAASLMSFFLWEGRQGAGCWTLCDQMLRAATVCKDTEKQAEWLLWRSRFLQWDGQKQAASEACHEAMGLLDKPKRSRLFADLLSQDADIDWDAGRMKSALARTLELYAYEQNELDGAGLETEFTASLRLEALGFLEDAAYGMRNCLDQSCVFHMRGERLLYCLRGISYGRILRKLGLNEAAACALSRIIEAYETVPAWGSLGLPSLYWEAGLTALRSGDRDSAGMCLRRGIEVFNPIDTANSGDFGRNVSNGGILAHQFGDLATASKIYSHERSEENFGAYCAIVMLGIVCRQQGRQLEAAQHLETGAILCDRLLHLTPERYDVRYIQAVCLIAMGNFPAAMSAYHEAVKVCSAPGVIADAIAILRLLEALEPECSGIRQALAYLSQNCGLPMRRVFEQFMWRTSTPVAHNRPLKEPRSSSRVENRQTESSSLVTTKSKIQSIGIGDARMKKTGRNQPCPCGSGKKFKKCCGT